MVAIYVRQSLDKKDSLSIESQINDCITLCKRNGWDDYQVYKDKGWSAKNLDRPEFQKMNNDVEAGKIKAVVCYKIDRISRSIRDLVNLIEDYHELGVHFVSFADNINTAAPGGLMMATLFGSLAQMEREAIIARVTDNYYYRCELGYWGGGPAPYGFNLKKIVENGQKHTVLEINEREAAVVKQFFKWYLEPDGTIYEILKKADKAGITTRKGGAWTSRVVSELLSKPMYAPNSMDIYNFYAAQGVRVRVTPEQCDGKLSLNVFGRRDRGSKHPKRSRPVNEMTLAICKTPPIIDSDTFLKAQFKKKAKLQVSPRTGTAKTTMLSGLVKCAVCGRAMSPSGSSRGVRYFTCSGKRNYAAGTCTSKSIKVAALEKIVTDDILRYATNPKVIDMFHAMQGSKLTAEQSHEVNLLQQETAKLDIEIDNLLDACSAGNATAIEYLNKRIEKLDNRKHDILNRINEIKKETENVISLFSGIEIENVPYILAHGSVDEKKNVCQFLLNVVLFTNADDVKVYYKM